ERVPCCVCSTAADSRVTGVIFGVGVGVAAGILLSSVEIVLIERERSGCETSFLALENTVTNVLGLKGSATTAVVFRSPRRKIENKKMMETQEIVIRERRGFSLGIGSSGR
ncbi:MAG TPA: hypothetical protein VIR01_18435, partial [Pyrinomonadaceae bacterium]